MGHRIDTAADFLSIRSTLATTYIESKTQGPVPVPCMDTLLVKPSMIVANTWNPNSVSDDKMDLLKQSILDNGFAFPVVVIWDDDLEKFVVVDGFHRTTIGGPDWLDFDYIPVAVLTHDITKRMTATVQFNKARGVHQVDLDADVIRTLIEQGMSEDQIAIHLGLDLETIHRYKQLTGIAELFKNVEYSRSWEMVEEGD